MPLGVHHLAIQVSDLAKCEAFYVSVLGLRVVRRWPWRAPDRARAGERSLWLALGADEAAGFLALEVVSEAPSPSDFNDARPRLHLLALRIEASERAAWEERFAAAGVAVVHRTDYTLYVRDPEGNRIGLSHWPGGSA